MAKPKAVRNSYGETLRRLIAKRGTSQTRLAEETGVGKGHLSKIINGKTQPRNLTLQKLAKGLGVKPGAITGEIPARDLAGITDDLIDAANAEFAAAELMRSDPILSEFVAQDIASGRQIFDHDRQLMSLETARGTIRVPCSLIYENRTNDLTPISLHSPVESNTREPIEVDRCDYLTKLRLLGKDLSYNNPTFFAKEIKIHGNRCHIVPGVTDYLSTIGVHDALEHELLSSAWRLKCEKRLSLDSLRHSLPLRQEFKSSSVVERRRHAGLAIGTVVASRSDAGDYNLHVRKRTGKTAVHANLMHVIPAGMFQFEIEPQAEWNIQYAVLKEYCEEWFGLVFDSKRESPTYISDEWPEFKSISELLLSGEAQLIHTGIVINLLNYRPDICCLLMIHEPGWFDKQRRSVNWEYLKRREIELAAFDAGMKGTTTYSLEGFEVEIAEALDREDRQAVHALAGRWVPPGLAALLLAVRVARRFKRLSGRQEG